MLFALIAGSLGYLGLMKWPKPPLPRSTSIPNALTMPKERTVKSSAHLYFINKDNSFLAAEKRELLHLDDATSLAKTIVNALITGPKDLVRTLPADSELRALFINQGKTAYVDFIQGKELKNIMRYSNYQRLTQVKPESAKKRYWQKPGNSFIRPRPLLFLMEIFPHLKYGLKIGIPSILIDRWDGIL